MIVYLWWFVEHSTPDLPLFHVLWAQKKRSRFETFLHNQKSGTGFLFNVPLLSSKNCKITGTFRKSATFGNFFELKKTNCKKTLKWWNSIINNENVMKKVALLALYTQKCHFFFLVFFFMKSGTFCSDFFSKCHFFQIAT